jgi:hypothetical protein
MQSIRGVVKEIKTRSVEKANGQTLIKNYSTTDGSSKITNSQVLVGNTKVSFTKSKNYEGLKFKKDDEVLVVGDIIGDSMVAINYHNITKNITECMENKFLALYGFVSVLFFAGFLWSVFQIFTNQTTTATYIILVFSIIFFLLFFTIFFSALRAKRFLLKEIKNLTTKDVV